MIGASEIHEILWGKSCTLGTWTGWHYEEAETEEEKRHKRRRGCERKGEWDSSWAKLMAEHYILVLAPGGPLETGCWFSDSLKVIVLFTVPSIPTMDPASAELA